MIKVVLNNTSKKKNYLKNNNNLSKNHCGFSFVLPPLPGMSPKQAGKGGGKRRKVGVREVRGSL